MNNVICIDFNHILTGQIIGNVLRYIAEHTAIIKSFLYLLKCGKTSVMPVIPFSIKENCTYRVNSLSLIIVIIIYARNYQAINTKCKQHQKK